MQASSALEDRDAVPQTAYANYADGFTYSIPVLLCRLYDPCHVPFGGAQYVNYPLYIF